MAFSYSTFDFFALSILITIAVNIAIISINLLSVQLLLSEHKINSATAIVLNSRKNTELADFFMDCEYFDNLSFNTKYNFVCNNDRLVLHSDIKSQQKTLINRRCHI